MAALPEIPYVLEQQARHLKTRVQSIVGAYLPHLPPGRPAWPVLGMLLIAPGIFTFEILLPHAAVAHSSGVNIAIEYPPVVHFNTPFEMRLSTMSVFGTGGEFAIRLDKKVGEHFALTSASPNPLKTETSAYGTVLYFAGGGKDAAILTFTPRVMGKVSATIQYGLDPPVPFSITTTP